MDKLKITGGARIEGEVPISGSKNAALPAMAATLLTPEEVRLGNLPLVRDIHTMRELISRLGAEIEVGEDHTGVTVAGTLDSSEASYDLVKTMRASVLVLGPLVARTGEARVSLPGGCAIGARPVDLHLEGLRRMGAEIRTDHGYIEVRARKLRGADIAFGRITVTGTENLMMAAALADGTTTLRNSASEPEVSDLAGLLNSMGARVHGAGTPTITIEGVERLHGASHTIIPDRIETGTFVVAAAITRGKLELTRTDLSLIETVAGKLRDAGVRIESDDGRILVSGVGTPVAIDVATREYPGFATDMQAQYMAFMTQARGTSVISENIFENRFMHASELVRMGADVKVDGARAIVRGPTPLSGARVIASDLRASASLVLAALVAEGETEIDRVYHLDRGYERIEEKLRAVGASIERIT
jgi:UDP-N-acetylglucosamine 1-carboxyvinyltransferase